MKFTTALAVLSVALPVVLAVPAQNSKIPTLTAKVASAAKTATAAATPKVNVAAATGGSAADLQSSLTLDPSQLSIGSENNGQATQETGQVASLVSKNNFINFCATLPQLPISNGEQILSGSCNPIIMGAIPAKTAVPTCKIASPLNLQVIPSNTSFTLVMNINQLITGHFTNADLTYFAAPQQLDPGTGQIVGHSHLVINPVKGVQDTVPGDATKFTFFKGLNAAAVNGQLTAAVTGGIPAGTYRVCSINTGANHAPVLGPVAQHTSFDDCTYFFVTDDASEVTNGPSATPPSLGGAASAGAASAGAASAGAASAGAASAGAAATASSASSAAANTAVAKGGSNNNNNNKNGKSRGGKDRGRGRGRF